MSLLMDEPVRPVATPRPSYVPELAQYGNLALEQIFTPLWAAESLVEKFLPDLAASDRVLEPSCGLGAFLQAIPENVPAIGVEIDPVLADIAAANSGREVICGDFLEAAINFQPNVILGNPPFSIKMVRKFLLRSYDLLPKDGRCAFLLPAHAFQASHSIVEWSEKWSISQHAIPRDIFPGIACPLVFAMFRKDTRRSLVGFALYHECDEVKRLKKQMRYILINGKARKTSWRALIEFALSNMGGKATLDAIYRTVDPLRHTANRWWKEKVRQELQRGPFIKEGDEWALAA